MTCRGKADEGIEKLDEGLAAWRKTGARLWLPTFLALKAEAHAGAGGSDAALKIIDEALAISDETGERWAVAEVLRIKAGLLQVHGPAAAPTKSKLYHARAWKPDGASRPFPGSYARHAILCASGRGRVVTMKP